MFEATNEDMWVVHEMEGHLSGIPHVSYSAATETEVGVEWAHSRSIRCKRCGVDVILTGAAGTTSWGPR